MTMVALQVAVFPQSSVAVQVLVTLANSGQTPGVVTSEKVTTTVASHASLTVGGVNTGDDRQSIGVVWAAQVIVGGVLSWTTMVALQVAVFKQSSVAVHVLVTLYAPAHAPGVVTSEKVTVTVPSQPSDAVGGLNAGAAGQLIGVVCATHVMVGGVLS